MRSPCLSCDLKNSSKDNPVCKDCDARCEYVRFLNGATSPIFTNSTKKGATVNRLKKAELYVQEACEKHCIDLDDLKSKRSSGGLGDIRREVFHALYYEHKLTQKEIGYMFGKSANSIWAVLQKKPIKSSVSADSAITANSLTPDAGDQVSVGRIINESDQPMEDLETNKIFTIIDFKDRPDLYDHLIKTAKNNFRKPEDHILYLINKEMQGEDKYEADFKPGTESP